jgi:hypothetical protein
MASQQEGGSNNQRRIRIKIHRENAKIVTEEEMRMLQIEAIAKLFHQRILNREDIGRLEETNGDHHHRGNSKASTRKSSSTSSNDDGKQAKFDDPTGKFLSGFKTQVSCFSY